jgi:Toprim-like/CHC2 zinc finger
MIKNSCEQAKLIDFVDYLASLGHEPTKIRNNDYWYLSPLRDEKESSFKVNRRKNVWYDHGIGKGGTLIDFGIIYHKCTVKELLIKLNEFNIEKFSFHPPQAGEKKKLSDEAGKIMIIDSRIISDPGLIKYLDDRKIPLVIAKKYCTEVDFELYGKKHTAIGFKNNAGGFELRNNYFKGSSSPKDITLIKNDNEELSVFEGFFSFLSFQTQELNKRTSLFDLPKKQSNFLILNSLSFFEKSRGLMEKHSRIQLYLDRDNSGIKNTDEALKWSAKYIDKSVHYKHCKDLNEFLISQKEKEIKQRNSLRRRL